MIAVDFGIVLPEQFAGGGVVRLQDAPAPGGVHDAVDHDRCCLKAAGGTRVPVPGQTEIPGIVHVDLLEGAETLFGIGTPVSQPVAGLRVGADDARGVHPAGVEGHRRRIPGGVQAFFASQQQCAGDAEDGKQPPRRTVQHDSPRSP